MLELEQLRPDQYQQVAEWEFQARGEGWDWERYEAEMDHPKWTHFGIYAGGEFVGCVSLETISRNTAAYHVVTARRKVKPNELADTMCDIAAYLFNHGFTAVVAHNPIDKRAGARLAIRCGMVEIGRSETTRFFIMTKVRFQKLRT